LSVMCPFFLADLAILFCLYFWSLIILHLGISSVSWVSRLTFCQIGEIFQPLFLQLLFFCGTGDWTHSLVKRTSINFFFNQKS
jgi:hypothetical protein